MAGRPRWGDAPDHFPIPFVNYCQLSSILIRSDVPLFLFHFILFILSISSSVTYSLRLKTYFFHKILAAIPITIFRWYRLSTISADAAESQVSSE